MRWFATLVIVTLVATGASRSQHRITRPEGATLRAAAGVADKLAPRRSAVVRGAIAERRMDADEVFIVPRLVDTTLTPTVAILSMLAPSPACAAVLLVDPTARGPPAGRAV